MAHFNAESFSHDSTGYTLRGRHGEAECRACHRPDLVLSPDVREFKEAGNALDRTFLGLGTDCANCHGGDDPHEDQFPDRDCASCHNEEAWEGAMEFDHSEARYPLKGRHQEVECARCHKKATGGDRSESIRYRPLEASTCRVCHEDPHRGSMRGACESCHVPEGWARVRKARVESSFDHATTRFPLKGAHAEARCQSCHDPNSARPGLRLTFPGGEVGARTYPRPRYDRCGTCHSDPHAGAFEAKECDDCHGGEAWTPAEFGLARHDETSLFPLTGAHRVTPCLACHQTGGQEGEALRFRLEGFEDCGSCHQEDDPHGSVFGDAPCETCHETGSFQMEDFDHDREAVQRWIQACSVCHGATQPHGEQFPRRECGECHSTKAYRIPEFDHSRSRFLLDGAHENLSCNQCHSREGGEEGSVRYRPLETTCAACHGGGR
ncbi:MAG: cytochrome c3 family protein [Longimicrobiales bacterium]